MSEPGLRRSAHTHTHISEIARRIRDGGQELVKKVNAVFGWRSAKTAELSESGVSQTLQNNIHSLNTSKDICQRGEE